MIETNELQEIIRECLRTLRGKYSQRRISLKLGHSHNQYFRWESGKTEVTWKMFIRICRSCGVDVRKMKIPSLERISDPEDSAGTFCALAPLKSTRELATLLEVTPITIRNWVRGKTSPSLRSMLKLLSLREDVRQMAVLLRSLRSHPVRTPVQPPFAQGMQASMPPGSSVMPQSAASVKGVLR